MRLSTTIAATIIRVGALTIAVWAGLRLLIWATRPLAALIYSYERDYGGFDFNDARELGQFALYLAAAAAVYVASLSIARSATAADEDSPAFALAFTCIRVFTFLCIVPGILSLAFELYEIFIDHLRDPGDWRSSMWSHARFRLRTVFSIALNLGFVSIFWVFARRISHALTRGLTVRPSASQTHGADAGPVGS